MSRNLFMLMMFTMMCLLLKIKCVAFIDALKKFLVHHGLQKKSFLFHIIYVKIFEP